MSTKNYEIVSKTILTKNGLKKIGETIKTGDIDKKRLEQYLEDGVIIGENEAKKAKKEAEQAKADAGASLAEVKKLKAAVDKAQSELVEQKEAFEAEKAAFEAEKKAFAKEVEDIKKLTDK